MFNIREYKILEQTKSVCPICLEVINAQIVVRGRAVYMEKTCEKHGPFSSYLWPDVEHYLWLNNFRLPTIRPRAVTSSIRGCPEDCGLCEAHLRKPTLVEIEVTERCNLRCPVCFMSAEEFRKTVRPDPSLEEIASKYDFILQNTEGDTSIQLTGGEPTVRSDLPEIVHIGREKGFRSIEINTNGVVIGRNLKYLYKLAKAGISGIYLQFDGLTNGVYEVIRGGDFLDIKLRAIENCRRAGVQVVLAMTVIYGINENQMGEVLDFALKNRDVIAGLAYQPAFGSGRFEVALEKDLTMGDVIFMLAKQSNGLIEPYDFWPLGCSNPHCSTSTYLVEVEQKLQPLTKLITPEEYIHSFDSNSPQGSVFADIAVEKFPKLELGLSILIENYMDANNLDLKKLRECSMVVAGRDGGLIPFCRYQLTNISEERCSEIQRSKE